MIYGDDNIHYAMEKIASLPRGLRRATKGIRNPKAGVVDFSKSKVPVGQEGRVLNHIEGRARARSIAQERSRMVREFGQREPRVLRADRTLLDRVLGRKGKPDYEGSTQALHRAVNPPHGTAARQGRLNYREAMRELPGVHP